MKKVILAIFLIVTITISCKKTTDQPPAPVTTKYMSNTAGSTWNYELVNNILVTTSLYTVTSTNRDSTINAKAYHVFTNSSATGNEYYNITGTDYYIYRSLPAGLGGSSIENIYLKENASVGNSWSQSYTVNLFGFPLNVTVTNTITEKGIGKTVNGIAYTDVIHVTTALTVTISGFPLPSSALQTDIQAYYARKVGMIQAINKVNINYSGIKDSTNQVTTLKSADIK